MGLRSVQFSIGRPGETSLRWWHLSRDVRESEGCHVHIERNSIWATGTASVECPEAKAPSAGAEGRRERNRKSIRG